MYGNKKYTQILPLATLYIKFVKLGITKKQVEILYKIYNVFM